MANDMEEVLIKVEQFDTNGRAVVESLNPLDNELDEDYENSNDSHINNSVHDDSGWIEASSFEDMNLMTAVTSLAQNQSILLHRIDQTCDMVKQLKASEKQRDKKIDEMYDLIVQMAKGQNIKTTASSSNVPKTNLATYRSSGKCTKEVQPPRAKTVTNPTPPTPVTHCELGEFASFKRNFRKLKGEVEIHDFVDKVNLFMADPDMKEYFVKFMRDWFNRKQLKEKTHCIDPHYRLVHLFFLTLMSNDDYMTYFNWKKSIISAKNCISLKSNKLFQDLMSGVLGFDVLDVQRPPRRDLTKRVASFNCIKETMRLTGETYKRNNMKAEKRNSRSQQHPNVLKKKARVDTEIDDQDESSQS